MDKTVIYVSNVRAKEEYEKATRMLSGMANAYALFLALVAVGLFSVVTNAIMAFPKWTVFILTMLLALLIFEVVRYMLYGFLSADIIFRMAGVKEYQYSDEEISLVLQIVVWYLNDVLDFLGRRKVIVFINAHVWAQEMAQAVEERTRESGEEVENVAKFLSLQREKFLAGIQ